MKMKLDQKNWIEVSDKDIEAEKVFLYTLEPGVWDS
jgi:hypothetical protein